MANFKKIIEECPNCLEDTTFTNNHGVCEFCFYGIETEIPAVTLEEVVLNICRGYGWEFDGGMVDLIEQNMEELGLDEAQAVVQWVSDTVLNQDFGGGGTYDV